MSGGRNETVTGRAKRLDPFEKKKLLLLAKGSLPEEVRLNPDRILAIEEITAESPG